MSELGYAEDSGDIPDEQSELVELMKLSRAQNRVLVQQNTLLRQQVCTITDSLQESNMKVQSLTDELEHTQKDNRTMKSELLEMLDTQRELHSTVEQQQVVLASEQRKCGELADVVEEAEVRINALSTALRDAHSNKSQSETQWQSERVQLKADLERLLTQNRQLQTQRIQSEARAQAMNSEAMEMTHRLEAARGQHQVYEDKIRLMTTEAEIQAEEVTKLMGKIRALEKSEAEAALARAVAEKETAQVRTLISKMESGWQVREEEIERKASELRTATVVQLQRDRERLSNSVVELETENARLRTEHESVRKAKERSEAELYRAKETVATSGTRQMQRDADFMQQVSSLTTRNQKLELDLESAMKKLARAELDTQGRMDTLKREASEGKALVDALKEKGHDLRVEVAMLTTQKESLTRELSSAQASLQDLARVHEAEMGEAVSQWKNQVAQLERRMSAVKSVGKKQEEQAVQMLLSQQQLRQRMQAETENERRAYDQALTHARAQIQTLQRQLLQVINSVGETAVSNHVNGDAAPGGLIAANVLLSAAAGMHNNPVIMTSSNSGGASTHLVR